MNRDVTLSCVCVLFFFFVFFLKAALLKWEFTAQILESRERAKMKRETQEITWAKRGLVGRTSQSVKSLKEKTSA